MNCVSDPVRPEGGRDRRAVAMRWLRAALLLCYGVLWAGGMVSYLVLGGPPADTAWAAPAFLGMAALLALAHATPGGRVVLIAAGLAAFVAEAVGVHTGFPFGRYVYTDVLAPHVAGVPLAIAGAWIVLFAYVRGMTAGVTRRAGRWPGVLAGTAWMVTLDLLIDPLAAGPLDYWRWAHAGLYCGIPWTNFAGWALVSFALFAATRRAADERNGQEWIGLSIVVFFTLIAIQRAVWPAAAVGAGLCVLHVMAQRTGRRAGNRRSG